MPTSRPFRRLVLGGFAAAALVLTVGVGVAERFGGTLLDGSRVSYDGSAGWETWQGVAPARLELLAFEDTDLTTLDLEIVVDPSDFDSGNFIRDANARRTVFETSQYPVIRYVVEDVAPATRSDGADAALDLPDGAERSLTLSGTLSLHGVDTTVEVPITVRRDGERLAVTGGFTVRLSDYAMNAPSIFGRSVDDEITIRFDLAVALGDV